jgi:hypothetical protein
MNAEQLADRIEDMSGDAPGSVRATVDYLLGSTWHALMDVAEGSAGLDRASEAIDEAIRALEHYRDRLRRMDDAETAEAVMHLGDRGEL